MIVGAILAGSAAAVLATPLVASLAPGAVWLVRNRCGKSYGLPVDFDALVAELIAEGA